MIYWYSQRCANNTFPFCIHHATTVYFNASCCCYKIPTCRVKIFNNLWNYLYDDPWIHDVQCHDIASIKSIKWLHAWLLIISCIVYVIANNYIDLIALVSNPDPPMSSWMYCITSMRKEGSGNSCTVFVSVWYAIKALVIYHLPPLDQPLMYSRLFFRYLFGFKFKDHKSQ